MCFSLDRFKKDFERDSKKELRLFPRWVDFIWRKKYKQLLIIIDIIGIVLIFFGEFLVKLIVDIENITFGEKIIGAIYYSTALIIFWYTRETFDLKVIQQKELEEVRKQSDFEKKMAENQLMPMVDVNMIYDKILKKTYFWFINASSIPAFALVKYNINNGEKEGIVNGKELRISPYHPHYPQAKRTAVAHLDIFNGDPPDQTKITLNIIITPAFKNYDNIEFKFDKSYRFEKSELQWYENTWGYQDLPYPH
jgi:hypothetical protein